MPPEAAFVPPPATPSETVVTVVEFSASTFALPSTRIELFVMSAVTVFPANTKETVPAAPVVLPPATATPTVRSSVEPNALTTKSPVRSRLESSIYDCAVPATRFKVSTTA